MELNYYTTKMETSELSGIYTSTGSALNFYSTTSSSLFYGC